MLSVAANPFMKKLFHLTTGDKEATRMFIQFCVLSGCDFLDSLPNMGIVVRTVVRSQLPVLLTS